jgi:hypothetical protein
MDELERQEQLLRQAMQELQESSTVSADSFDRLNRETSKLGKTIDNAEEALDKFWRGPVGKTTKALGDVAKGALDAGLAARKNRESFESLNPAIEGVASALSAIPIVGDALGKTLSGVGTFVTAELQRSVEAFQTLGSVGGVGAAGLTGLKDSAREAGLAFDQLAKITANNATGLAFATGSTAEGARAVAELTRAARPFQNQLLALGIGITEQTEQFADYLVLNRRLNRAQTNDYRTLASGAADYAKQLNTLSRLTGLSADAVKAELEQQMSNVQFRASLRMMDEKTQKEAINIVTAIGAVDKNIGMGIQDMFGGGVGTKAAQDAFRATGGAALDIINQFKAGALSQEEATARIVEAAGRQAEAIGDQFQSVAGNMPTAFQDVLLGMNNLRDSTNLTAENIRRVGLESVIAAQAQDPQTKGMVNAQQSLQSFAMEMDKFVDSQVMPKATTVIEKLVGGLDKVAGGINKLADGLPSEARASGGPVTGGTPYLVGELGPEIVVPNSSGTVIPSNQLVALFDQVQKMGKGSQLVEGTGQTFLPGVGFATSMQAGGLDVAKITDFSGAEIANKTSMSLDSMIGTMSGMATQYTAGPRDSYANEIFGRDMISQLTAGQFGGEKATVTAEGDMVKTEALFKSMTEALTAELRTIAANTKTGADSSKKLLRASAG